MNSIIGTGMERVLSQVQGWFETGSNGKELDAFRVADETIR